MQEDHFFSDKLTGNVDIFSADNKQLFDLSLRFANGDDDIEADFIAAHICLNIAAMRGCQQSAEYRKELCFDMTQDEIAQALKEARLLFNKIKNINLN